jgi:hypothetical protein
MAHRGNRPADDPLSECRKCHGKYEPTDSGRSRLCPRCIAKSVNESTRQRRVTLAEDILRENYPDTYYELAERFEGAELSEKCQKAWALMEGI